MSLEAPPLQSPLPDHAERVRGFFSITLSPRIALNLSPSANYFACTLEVIEAITPLAVLNGPAAVPVMPWRRAIQPKSV